MFSRIQLTWSLCRYSIIMMLALGVIGAFTTNDVTAQSGPPEDIETPFQASLGQSIRARQTAGLPAPQITTRAETQTILLDGDEVTEIIAITDVEFANPQQAGFDTWPDFQVEDNLPPELDGTVTEGDYTQQLYDQLEEASPGIWEIYEQGQEPRTYSYVEEMIVPQQSITQAVEEAFAIAQASTNEDILVGFTYDGPQLSYFVEATFLVPIPLPPFLIEGASFRAGFELDWGAGLRLPANIDLTGPSVMELGESYDFQSTVLTEDWSVSDFNSVGVAAEGGNEFVFFTEFAIIIEGEIAGIDICDDCGVEVGFDESRTFETPLGAGAEFPIPSINIPVYDVDLAVFAFEVGFEIDPNIGSDELRASWRALPGTDAQGSGTLVYTFDGETVTFGSILACNLAPGNEATVEIYDFEYAFTQFEIDLNAYLDFELFGFGGEVANPTLFTLDLSPITGELYVPDHIQCDFLFNCSEQGPDNIVQLSVPVVDVDAPFTDVSLSGTAGNNGWYVSDVDVTLIPEDMPLDCGNGVDYTEYSLDGETFQPYTGTITLTEEGINTVYYYSVDVDGNIEDVKSIEVLIDKTPPDISCYPTPEANAFGWNNTDVTVTWEATDAVSGIAFVSPAVVISTEGANQFAMGYAEDIAGNTADCSVLNINIDKTPPIVTIDEPDPVTYDNTDAFTVDWTVTDALSGVQSEAGLMDGNTTANGESINLLIFAAGEHTFTVEALDFADNPNSASVTFFVDVDIDGLSDSVAFMCMEGLINKQGICNALQAKLNAASRAIDRGQNHTACNILNAFINQVNAQNGNAIDPAMASILVTNAQYVCDNLPDAEAPAEEEVIVAPAPVVVSEPEGAAPANNGHPGNANGNSNRQSANGNGNSNGQGSNGQPANTSSNTQPGNANGNSNGQSANGNGNGNSNGQGRP